MIDRIPTALRDGGWPIRLLIICLVLLAYYLGTLRPMVSIHTGIAHSAEGAISIEADGSTHSVPVDGVTWVDSAGWHESGRPTCLPPTGTTGPVRFASIEASIEGVTWRPVVWVDCR